jgi:predicted HD phosphohydrolase
VLEELRRQEHVTLEGYRITRLEHGLQSATRAERDGADIDWIVAALLHDIGDGLAPQNHDRMSAEVIRPFVRWDVAWVVEHHGIFQMLYYAHHYGWDRNARDRFRDHPCFDSCAEFCERWDQSSFDPDYDSPAAGAFRADGARGLRTQGLRPGGHSRRPRLSAHVGPGLGDSALCPLRRVPTGR